MLLLTSLVYPAVAFGALSSVLLSARYGRDPGDCLGVAVAGLGDIDGDGLGDYIAGAPKSCSGGTSKAGYASIFSGRTGALIYKVSGGVDGDSFGSAVAGAGDVDGDGVPDFAVGAPSTSPGGGTPGSGAFYVYSGATGKLIYRRFGGTGDGIVGDGIGNSLAAIGDVDGDGVGDLVVAGAHAFGAGGLGYGSAFVYSGATGTLLYREDSVDGTELFATSVAAVGDVDGDGKGDFLVAAPNYSCGTPNLPQGAAYLYSGAARTPLRRLGAMELCTGFGATISGCEDIDGDGRRDVVVGAPSATISILGHAGSAFFFSSASGTELRRVNGTQGNELLGSAMADVGDVDGDGNREVAIGAPDLLIPTPQGFGEGAAILYSPQADSVVWQFNGSTLNERFGDVIQGAGDVNGDGREDLLVGSESGRGVFVYGLVNLVQARALTPSGPLPINLSVARSPICIQVEPVAGSYSNGAVVVPSIVMREQSDDLSEVTPQSVDTSPAVDTDGNGVGELSVCFSKVDLRRFFSNLPNGAVDSVRIEGNLSNGDRFRATLPIRVGFASDLVIAAAPNPMIGKGAISFRLPGAGSLRAQLFDISGRLVHTLADGVFSSGYHDLAIDGYSSEGRRLPSGVYFYRIETPAAVTRGEFVFLR